MKKPKIYCDSITPKYNYLDKETNVRDYVNYCINRALAMFKYNGLPDTIPQTALEKFNIMRGFTIWAKVNGELYVFEGGLGGEPDVYGFPTIATVANPALKFSGNFTIGEDCVIMPNDAMYMGLLPLFNRYCSLINENDITMLLADVNKRAQFIISATDDNTADSANQFLKKLFNGEQATITDNAIMSGLQVNPATTANIAIMDLVEYQQYLRAGLYNEIGLNSNFNMKREKLTATEVEMNSGNLYPLVDDMLNQRRIALEKINAMFGTEITVEFASAWTMRATETGAVENPVEFASAWTMRATETGNVEDVQNPDTPQEAADEPQDTPQDTPQDDTTPDPETPPDEPQDAAGEPQDTPQDETTPDPETPQDTPQEDENNETV